MKFIKYMVVVCLFASLAACRSKKPPKPAHFRMLSMIQYAPATLSIKGQGKRKKIHKTVDLTYANPSRYLQFAPGRYKIILRVKGKPLLQGTYILGKDGYYTLLAVGLLPKKWSVNPETTMYHLKHIFAGEELESTNKYLPQWFMMRDNYDGSRQSAYIRLVNANPHTPSLTVRADNQSLKSGLAYPVESGFTKLKAGTHTLHITYGKVMVAEKALHATAGYIYTAVLGSKKHGNDQLTVHILSNPSRTLLHSKQPFGQPVQYSRELCKASSKY